MNKEEEENVSDEQFQSIKEDFLRVLEKSQANEEHKALFFEFEKYFKKKRELQLAVEGDLGKDGKKAWDLVELARMKELAISKTVTQLEDQLKNVSSQLDDERAICSRQTKDYNQALKDRDALKTKVTELSENSNQLEKKVSELEYRNETLEEKSEDLRTKNAKLLDDISEIEGKLKCEKTKCDLIEKDLVELQHKYDIKVQEHAEILHLETEAKNKFDKVNKALRDTQQKMESRDVVLSELNGNNKDLEDNLKVKKDQLNKAISELDEVRKRLDEANSTNRKLEADKAQLQRKSDHEHKTVLRLQQSIDDIKAMNISSQQEIQTLYRDLDKIRESENELQRQKRLLERDKNMQVDKIQRIEKMIKQADEDAWHQEQTVLSLNNDLSCAKSDIDKVQKKVNKLEQLCEKQNNDIAEKQKTLAKTNTEIHSREIEIQEMKKQVAQLSSKLKDQEQFSNKCRIEQGKALRELLDEKNECQNAKNRNNVLSLEIETLRNELLSKDESLVKTHFEKRKDATKKEHLSNELLALRRQIVDRDDIIQKQDLGMQRLNMTIKHMDEDAILQKKEYDQLLNERDILSSQIIRRNDEVALLYEKVKIQTITLSKGEMQYKERIEDLRHLEIKLQDTKRELNYVKNGNLDQSGISKELIQREKELLNEKIKVKALSEELQNPVNVHRWRKLEGSDPSKFELVQKNEVLQKRLICKSEEVSNCD